MYNRKRISRGMGATLAVWGLIGLIVASTGVAYAAPVAGVGGFNIVASEINADELVLYPGVDDTSEKSAYPQTVAELRGAEIRQLVLYKTLDLGGVPGLSGQARIQLMSDGEINSRNMLVKSSAITSDSSTFNGFTLDESNTNDPSTALTIGAGDGATLQNAGIQAHYLATSSISLKNLGLQVCYDPDDDGQWETGSCLVGDPVGEGINTPEGIGEIDTDYQPDTPEGEENDDDSNTTPGDAVEAVENAAETVGNAVEDAAESVGNAVENAAEEVASWF